MKAIVFLGIALAVAVAAAGCTGAGTRGTTTTATPAGDGGVNETLTLFVERAGTLLDATDSNVSQAAAELGRTGLAGSAADAVLLNLSRSAGFVIDAVAYAPDGRVVAAAPAKYGSLVGTNLTDATTPADFYKMAYLGPYDQLAEGFWGVALGYPVTDANRTTVGGVSVAVRPELLLKGPAEDARGSRPLALFAVQTNGTILYADDPALVGQQMSQPGTGLAGLAAQITATRSGVATHRPANAAADRTMAWETVGLHGTEWRLIVAQR